MTRTPLLFGSLLITSAVACSSDDDPAPPPNPTVTTGSAAGGAGGTSVGGSGAGAGDAGGGATSGGGGQPPGGVVDDAAVAALLAAAPGEPLQFSSLGVAGNERHDVVFDDAAQNYVTVLGPDWLYRDLNGAGVAIIDEPSGSSFTRGIAATPEGAAALLTDGGGAGQLMSFVEAGGAPTVGAIDALPATTEYLALISGGFGVYGRDGSGTPILARYSEAGGALTQIDALPVAGPDSAVGAAHAGDRLFVVGGGPSNAVHAFDFGTATPAWTASPSYSASSSETIEPMSVRVGEDGVVRAAYRYRDTSGAVERRSCLIASYTEDGTSLGEIHLLDANPAFGGFEMTCVEATSDPDGGLYVVGFLDTATIATTEQVGYHLYAAKVGAGGALDWLVVIDDEWYTNPDSSYRDAGPGDARIETRVINDGFPVLLFSGTARRPGGAIRFFALPRE